VRRPARDDDLLVRDRLPDALADRDLQAGIEHDPELGPALVILERQPAAGLDGDDLDAAGVLVGKAAELAPGADILDDPAREAVLGRGLRAQRLTWILRVLRIDGEARRFHE
jgi:hypothetical protein